jgi:hypothetical protein
MIYLLCVLLLARTQLPEVELPPDRQSVSNKKGQNKKGHSLRVHGPQECTHQHGQIGLVGWKWPHRDGRQQIDSREEYQSWQLYAPKKSVKHWIV